MASSLEDMGKENASVAGQKETASEKTAAEVFGNCGVISVLFETPSGFKPSGFAIFGYDAVKLPEPDALQHIWADFVNALKAVVWLKAFRAFEDNHHAINNTSMSHQLGSMILENVVDGQTLAVGNEDYKNVIQDCLKIPCVYSPVIKELMWGLRLQFWSFFPAENFDIATNEVWFPMSEGMLSFLDSHAFDVNPQMMVTKRIIAMAGIMYECDRCVNKYDTFLRIAAQFLLKKSRIETSDWDLLKLATAFKIICDPEDEISDAELLFPIRVLKRLTKHAQKHAPLYKDKMTKDPFLEIYKEIYSARERRFDASRVLASLLKRAKKEYEDEQAGKAARDCEIGPDRKKIRRHLAPAIIGDLTEWHTMLSAKRESRRDSPNLASVDALKEYTQISSHPLNMTNRPGILSMDIHPWKDNIVATGGIDTNVVLFDFPSSRILSTLTGHSKKITSLKFVNGDGLIITGSADKTVRIWQGSEDFNYSCINTLKDHTAEVEAVAIHASQKYCVTISKDNSWCFYDISTGSCLAQVGEPSWLEGYTSAAFHPGGLLFGIGTTDGAVEIWDLKASVLRRSRVKKVDGWHVGPVKSMSFSENGYFLATAGLDGVKIWDLRTYGDIRAFGDTDMTKKPINAVEFDCSGSYLAVGGSDASVYKAFHNWNVIKTLTDPSGTEKVTSMKFGADARYIAVGSMEQNLRIFGSQSYEQSTQDTQNSFVY